MTILDTLHQWVDLLLMPVTVALLLGAVISVADLGMALGERLFGIRRLSEKRDITRLERFARARIDRSDLLTRIGPMLGLMGTLIPLGPGLAALGEGDVRALASSVTVAFDSTVLGLWVGMLGFIVGRARRRWYERALRALECADA